ncbi:MAG: peptide chain release factor-like protein [candidate division WOR-3 bacterium]
MRFGVSIEKERELEARLARLGIREDDIVERFIRSSGPGGQNVNKVATGVYLKHLPTGIEVKVTQERSQALNRFLARRLLAEKIEAQILKRRTEEQERIARLRKQKRKRSKRAQEKVLRLKRLQAEKKLLRQPPEE